MEVLTEYWLSTHKAQQGLVCAGDGNACDKMPFSLNLGMVV